MDSHKYKKLTENTADILIEPPQTLTAQKSILNEQDDYKIEIQTNKSESTNGQGFENKSNTKKGKDDKKDQDYAVVLRNIHKTFLIGIEGVPALRGISLKIKTGEFLIILGTSGGGKTSLLNIVGTIDTPSRGDLKIFNTIIRSKTNDEVLSSIRTDQVAFVFQSFNLLPSMNVLENVEIPMKIKGDLSAAQIKQRAIELLAMVGLSTRLFHFPNQLSGGEQQRVTIARALSNNPKILLLDEPTGDLDTKNSDIVMDILLDLNRKENITMLMVTHDVGLKNYGHNVVRVVDGKIAHRYEIDENLREKNIQELKQRISNKDLVLREGVTVKVDYKEINSEVLSSHIDINRNDSYVEENKTGRTFYRDVKDYKIKKQAINN